MRNLIILVITSIESTSRSSDLSILLLAIVLTFIIATPIFPFSYPFQVWVVKVLELKLIIWVVRSIIWEAKLMF